MIITFSFPNHFCTSITLLLVNFPVFHFSMLYVAVDPFYSCSLRSHLLSMGTVFLLLFFQFLVDAS